MTCPGHWQYRWLRAGRGMSAPMIGGFPLAVWCRPTRPPLRVATDRARQDESA